MRRYAVSVPRDVQDQITAQVLYIAEHSVDNALAWEARLDRQVDALGDAPGLAVDEDATARLGFVVRKCVFEGTYLIHFVADDAAGVVRVINFRHGARRPARGEL